MKGGVILFRGNGAAARRYVEADRSRADDYYLGADDTVAEYAVLDARGEVTAARSLSAVEYEGWVDWINPESGESMGTPRQAGERSKGSPLFAEMTINAPKSLSVAAALHPEVSEALDAAQQDALTEIRRWLGQHSVTRVGPRNAREVVPIEHMQVVGITHKTSRAGDPHRHIHMQIGTRIFAAGKWRALDTAALFKQQGAIRALGTAVIAAHPQLAQTLAEHGLTLDPASGEVSELQPFNGVMSKRSAQIKRNLERLEAEWEQAHPGEQLGPVMTARLQGIAWTYQRPGKKPADLKNEQWWVQELRDAGYDPATSERRAAQPAVAVDELSVQEVASRALDRCAAGASAWTRHTIQEHVTRITTEAGVQVAPAELREFITVATELAASDCFSVLPPGSATPEHVAHLTSLSVVAAETALRDQLTAATQRREPEHPDVTEAARTAGLDEGQTLAAAAVASTDALVIVEGAAGSGKTNMLRAAIEVAAEHGRASRVVAPTLRAAQVAHEELGVPATSVAALVYAHGWRWNRDGVWTRLAVGDLDPESKRTYTGPPKDAVLSRGERVIVDEAGMLDQDTAHALFAVTAEAGTTVALVGDRAQLPAVGRGGVLDMAAQIRGRRYDMTELHRFTDPDYAALTLAMRDRETPGDVFDQLAAMGLVTLHADDEQAREHIAEHAHDGEAITVATNDEAAELNERIRTGRIERGEVDDEVTATGSDGLAIGGGDLIQTRRNDTALGVANRQQWIVQQVTDDGTVYAREVGSGRKNPRTVTLSPEYVGEHAHLSYAATAYGVQGATVAASHTILSEATTAAGVYVGMTRGREVNRLHVVAENMADARAQFIEALERDPADRGLAHATRAAEDAVRGMIVDGPVQFVNDEIAALLQRADSAQVVAERWQRVSAALSNLNAGEMARRETARATEQAARARVEQMREQITTPLVSSARAAFTAWQQSEAAERAAGSQLREASWLGKRRAREEHERATARLNDVREQLTNEWGESPRWNDRVDGWVERVTRPRIDNDPGLADAEREHRAARDASLSRPEQARAARLTAVARVFGVDTVARNRQAYLTANPAQEAARAAKTANQARKEAELLRSLTPAEAVARIERTRAAQRARQAEQVEQERRRRSAFDQQRRSTPEQGGFSRGL
ncbi:conjugative relaxase-like TrwC/TraI family protein [Salana multivorans]|uniref:Conjugative relaxase-like TrwC/TraI family protein n=2 Tax=Salana multivorans TaxID=120377 RepID=A0A3N2D810_9MICO|nr:conjugative relaxase-like TrwC/TraI family protein [Salana multivorans]